jgi:threonine dehydrogenase-like Zn-dependent dehydrogenase
MTGMKAALTDGQGKVWIGEVPRPEPNPYQCLCRMLACATCTGTDLKHIHNKLPWQQTYPGILGHESIGEVIALGAKVRNYRLGDWVLRACAVYPGGTLGGFTSMWGGFAEYGLVTDAAAQRADHPDAAPDGYSRFQLTVPRDLGVRAADWTMAITLKETAGYVASLGVRLNSSVAVLGAGSVGIALLRFAKIFGATPLLAVARRAEQLDYARQVVGADAVVNVSREDPAARLRELTGERGLDLIIDSSGDADFVARCAPALNEQGKVAGYATYPRGDSLAGRLPAERIASGTTGEQEAHEYMIGAVRLGLVNLRDYYTGTLPLAEIAEGFARLERKQAMKWVFVMEG